MGVELLERDRFLLTLDELLCQAAEGQGHTVLVSGEAGIGKTAVIECFLERCQSATRVLWGSCEALFTPRPHPEIAERLSTTPKTVEHHVTAVLAKLAVRTRTEAVRAAYQLGLLPQTPTSNLGV